jgi:hypothetical protein
MKRPIAHNLAVLLLFTEYIGIVELINKLTIV